jgi:hypothetical protein
MQQVGQYRAVGDIGRRSDHCMDQLATTVDPEMRLHAEIPLVALLRLMHFGIARLVDILGRRRRIDDCRIGPREGGDRAGGYLQPLRRQMPLHLIEQRPAEIDADKTPHCQRS